MMKQTGKFIFVFFLFSVFGLSACSDNPSSSDASFNEEIPLIIQAVSEDADLFDLSGMDDEEMGSSANNAVNQLAKTNQTLDVIKFGRLGHFKRDTVLVEFDSDTTATATVIHSLDGEFVILARDTSDSTHGVRRITKEMTNTIMRKVKLVKKPNAFADGDSSENRRNWKITQISLAVGSSDAPTVAIEQVRISSKALASDLVITDPLETFLDRKSGIPEFDRQDTIKVFVTVSNTNDFPPEPGETVLLRHRMHRFSIRSRKALHDDGVYPDAVAGDGVFSGFFVKQMLFGIRHSALDVIDNGTIYDDTAPYNSVFWALPYRNRIR